jgi:hypothetical protein
MAGLTETKLPATAYRCRVAINSSFLHALQCMRRVDGPALPGSPVLRRAIAGTEVP